MYHRASFLWRIISTFPLKLSRNVFLNSTFAQVTTSANSTTLFFVLSDELPMGSPLNHSSLTSPWISSNTRFSSAILPLLPYNIVYWITSSVSRTVLLHFYNFFNSRYPSLKFTLKTNGLSLNLLDLFVTLRKNCHISEIFYKPICTASLHHLSHKTTSHHSLVHGWVSVRLSHTEPK